jgi:DNA recombination protein RmuC
MDTIFLLIVGVLAVLLVVFIVLFFRSRKGGDNQSMVLIQNQINEIRQTLDNRLGESTKMMQTQFGESTKIIQEVTEKLVKLDETNRQVVNFADQLKNLQDILKNPKQRGVLGEYYLETVLKNVLPPEAYKTQYEFKDGTIVDAAIFIDKRVIPIDSKFSLENYNRLLESSSAEDKKRYEQAFVNDIKERINETSKYVKPEEGTMDFAFMFIPSEAIYYDLLINKVGSIGAEGKNLIHHAGQKRVIITSPTSFLAYLQTVLQGLRNQKISQQAHEIIKQVENLSRHLGSYEEYMKKMGTNLGTTVNMYNNAYKEFKKIDKDVLKISGEATGIEPELLDKPTAHEEVD